MRRRLTPEQLVTLLAVAGAVVFVLVQLQPSKLLLNTTPTGGDMGAHVLAPAYLRDHLLPDFRLTGWSPDWYAGFPILTFYFPLPSFLIVLLDVVLPYNVAFKLISVSGLLALPVAAWAFGRLSGMRFPGPPLLALASVGFLFERGYTILGGNIPSTLAGEFSFSIGLAIALLFLGVVARGLDDGRHRALAAVLLAACALSHVLTTLFAILGAVVLLLQRLDRKRVLHWIVPVGALSFAIAAFWAVPVIFRLPYMNDMGWERTNVYLEKLFWPGHAWVWVLGAIGAVVSVVLARRTGTVVTTLAISSALAFRLLPQGRLWNERFLPFWYLCVYLLAAVALAELAVWLTGIVRGMHLLDRTRAEGPATGWAAPMTPEIEAMLAQAGATEAAEPRPAPPVDVEAAIAAPPPPDEPASWRWPSLAMPIAAGLALFLVVGAPLRAFPYADRLTNDRSFIPDWVRWNYSGVERKAAYGEYWGMVQTMDRVGRTHGCGRAMWEYGFDQLNPYGTPMAPMLLPYWTDRCIGSMEGLYFESAATVPYHFLNQSELSKGPSRAMRDLPYRDLDFANGIRHLQLLGVRYYLAFSPEALAQANAHPDLKRIAASPPWEVFEVADSAVVEPLTYEPVVLEDAPTGGDRWVDIGVAAYQQLGDALFAASGPPGWERMPIGEKAPTLAANGATVIGSDVALDDAPRNRVARPARVSRIRTTDDRISFEVDRPGTPVLVKTSYFPNWKASGARGPWRVAPNLMVVVPTERQVSLHYGYTPVDVGGWLLTVVGIAGAVWLARRPRVEYDDELDTAEVGDAGASGGPGEPGDSGDARRAAHDDDRAGVPVGGSLAVGEPDGRDAGPVVTTP